MLTPHASRSVDIAAWLAAAALALSLTAPAFAQGAAPLPPEHDKAPAERPVPAPSPPLPGGTPDENLSRRLEESEGVIKPPRTGDTEIHVPPKDDSAGRMPIIPPPGSPGGRQDVQPK